MSCTAAENFRVLTLGSSQSTWTSMKCGRVFGSHGSSFSISSMVPSLDAVIQTCRWARVLKSDRFKSRWAQKPERLCKTSNLVQGYQCNAEGGRKDPRGVCRWTHCDLRPNARHILQKGQVK
eukprot:1158586-Pelagomonas_calceolata.AAC.5